MGSIVSKTQVKVFIVDDHPVVRRGLAEVIGQEADMQVCGEAGDVADAMRKIEASAPDVVVVDISLDNESGIELIEHVHARWPATKTLVSSAHDEQVYAGRVLRAGALGYVSKRESLSKIVEAIRHVLRGGVYLSPQMAAAMLQRAATGQSVDRDPVETLTNRELEVFRMIGQGLSTGQIAESLQVSPKTVESYRKVIKVKLNVHTAAQLSREAFQWAQTHQ